MKKILTDKTKLLAIAKTLSDLLENKFKIWKFSFGLDPLFGIVPILGDIVPALVSLFIIYVAILHKVETQKILMMLLYIFLDFWAGSIPVLGNVVDFLLKSNTVNIQIIEDTLLDKTK